MASSALTRLLVFHQRTLSLALFKHTFHSSPLSCQSYPPRTSALLSSSTSVANNLHRGPISSFMRFFTAGTDGDPKPKPRNTKVNFSLSDSDSDSESDLRVTTSSRSKTREIEKSKLPPPYDPFNKKPAIEEPEGPKNLQEIFHKMRTDGLTDYAVKMFDGLSKDGRTHEALELFSQIKDKGHMPDVVAHTAVIEVYANAGGQSKEALKVFMRMLASGVEPNAYTYAVLVKGLAGDGKLGDVKKYVTEMMEKGIAPNAGTTVVVFEAFVREGKEAEAREFLEQMKSRGFVVDEKGVREVLKTKRGPDVRTVMDILFGK